MSLPILAEEHEENAHLAEAKATLVSFEMAALEWLSAAYGYRTRADEPGRARVEWLLRAAKCFERAASCCERAAECCNRSADSPLRLVTQG